jgi:hypothetical protein
VSGARAKRLRFTTPKELHVSPFMPMELDYAFRIAVPGDRLALSIHALLAGRRPVGVAKLLFPRLEQRGLGHDLPCKRLLIPRSHDQPAPRKANPITLS